MTYEEYKYIENIRQIAITFTELREKAQSFPRGSLVWHKRDGKADQPYWHFWNAGCMHYTFINRSESPELFAALCEKQAFSADGKQTLNILSEILKANEKIVSRILDNLKIIPVRSFEASVSENSKYPIIHGYYTEHGEIVRSKSEVIVANAFYRLGIPYIYESRIAVGEDEFFPDFKIKNPFHGGDSFHEHAGQTSSDYIKKLNYKRAAFASFEMLEGRDYFITDEGDVKDILNVLAGLYTAARYDVIRAAYHELK